MNFTGSYVKIKGRVQGVNFRYYAKKRAEQLGLVGWIKNTSKGEVECLAEGEKEALEKFLQWCRQGSKSARVREMEIHRFAPGEKFDSFDILY